MSVNNVQLKDGSKYPLSPAYRTPITGTGTHGVMDYPVNVNSYTQMTANPAVNGTITITTDVGGESTTKIYPIFKLFDTTLTEDELRALSAEGLTISGQFIAQSSLFSSTNMHIYNYGYGSAGDIGTFWLNYKAGSSDMSISLNIPACHILIGALPYLVASVSSTTVSGTVSISGTSVGTVQVSVPTTGSYIWGLMIDPMDSSDPTVPSQSNPFILQGTFNVADYKLDPRYTGNASTFTANRLSSVTPTPTLSSITGYNTQEITIPVIEISDVELRACLQDENGLLLTGAYSNIEAVLCKNINRPLCLVINDLTRYISSQGKLVTGLGMTFSFGYMAPTNVFAWNFIGYDASNNYVVSYTLSYDSVNHTLKLPIQNIEIPQST